ncbi:MAG: hypothetical protein ACLTYW_05530 [Collinsella sp.]
MRVNSLDFTFCHLSAPEERFMKGVCNNIMLACCVGMSTSLVVSKMEEAAKAQGKDDYNI